MKKLILGISIIMFFAVTTFAQGGKRMQAQKVAFITNYIELTPEEAEVFWPIYKEFEKEKRMIYKKYKSQNEITDMTDAELEEQFTLIFKKDQEQLDLKKEYFTKMKKILPIRKIVMLRIAEREFKNSILDQLKEKRRERRGKRRNQNN